MFFPDYLSFCTVGTYLNNKALIDSQYVQLEGQFHGVVSFTPEGFTGNCVRGIKLYGLNLDLADLSYGLQRTVITAAL